VAWAAAASYRGSIYVAGGDVLGAGSTKVYRLTPPSSTWEAVADLPTPRTDAHLIVVADTLYMVGGQDVLPPGNVYRPSKAVWAFDPGSETWLTRPFFPDNRSGWAVSAGDRIVVVGGGSGSVDHGGLFPGDSVVTFTPGDSIWHYRTPLTQKRVNPMAAAIGTKVYTFGGMRDGTVEPFNSYEIYDVVTDAWSTGGQLHVVPKTVSNMSVSVLNGRVHFLGGGLGRRDHLIFDPLTDEWEAAPLIPSGRGGGATVAHDGALWVIGGIQGPRNQPGSFLRGVAVYTPE